tara:strand:- start:64 stop:765 length:702 start_codon:yes stop_codon:yes gene_type:complete
METYGDIKKAIKAIKLKQKGEKIGNLAIDVALDAIPGIGAAKTTFDFFKAAFKKPDDRKTSSWLDKLDVDDEMSDIVDDTVENGFLKAVAASMEKKPDEEKLDPNFDMNEKMVKYLEEKYKGRTITGIKENKRKMKKSELRQLIKEELNNFNEAEEAVPEKSGLDTKINITQLVKKLGGVDISKFNSAFKLLQQGKPLNNLSNKVMADTFVALMKNTDDALANKFKLAFKKIN